MNLAQGIAHHARRIEHVRRAKYRAAGSRLRRASRASKLTTAWVIARLPADMQHQHPVVRPLERRHLAEGVDLIDTGVGPRIGQQHEPGVDQQADAVSHERRNSTSLLLL